MVVEKARAVFLCFDFGQRARRQRARERERESGLENNRRQEKARLLIAKRRVSLSYVFGGVGDGRRGEIRQSIYRSAIHSSHVHAGETRNSIGTPCSAQVCVRTRQPFLRPSAELPLSLPSHAENVGEVRQRERHRGLGSRGNDFGFEREEKGIRDV